MAEEDMEALVREHKRLMFEDIIIDALLKKVRKEMNKYEVERLQLDNMLLNESVPKSDKDVDNLGMPVDASSSQTDVYAAASTSGTQNLDSETPDMDSVERINQTPLDLKVTDSLLQMFHGEFYNDDEEEEDEYDIEEEDEDVEEEGESKPFESDCNMEEMEGFHFN